MDTVEALISSRPPKYDGQDHRASWGRRYPLRGQGVLLFNLTRSTPFTISISPAKPHRHHTTPGYLALKIYEDEAQFVFRDPGSSQVAVVKAHTKENSPGYVSGLITTYWYSFDHQNYVSIFDDSAIRSDQSVSFNIGSGRVPVLMHAYLFFYRGSASSLILFDSIYKIVSI